MANPATRAQPRTSQQNRAIWAAVRELSTAGGMSRDEAEDIMRGRCADLCGDRSTQRLTSGQAQMLLAQLHDLVAASRPRTARDVPRRSTRPSTTAAEEARGEARITPRQQEVLDALYRQIGWTDQKRRAAFSMRQTGRPWPQSQAEADKIMEPLKAMALRGLSPEDARARFVALDGHPGLDTWQRGFVADVLRQFAEAEPKKVMSPHKLLKLIEAEIAVARTA